MPELIDRPDARPIRLTARRQQQIQRANQHQPDQDHAPGSPHRATSPSHDILPQTQRADHSLRIVFTHTRVDLSTATPTLGQRPPSCSVLHCEHDPGPAPVLSSGPGPAPRFVLAFWGWRGGSPNPADSPHPPGTLTAPPASPHPTRPPRGSQANPAHGTGTRPHSLYMASLVADP